MRHAEEKKPGRPSIGSSEPYTEIPVIYGIFHVDKNNLPPTGTQYLKVLEFCDRHAKYRGKRSYDEASPEIQQECDSFAQTIDNFMSVGRAAWQKTDVNKNGGRRYLQDKGSLQNLQQWTKIVATRVEAMNNKNESLPWCPAIVGYTYRASKRQQEHRQHIGSNTLTNLVEIICKIIFPGNQLEMRFQVLFEIWNRDQAGPMEHVLSHLAMSYIYLGGFNGSCTGKSNRSASRIPL